MRGVGALQRTDAEHLRRLRQPFVAAVDGGGHAAMRLGFQRVGQRQGQQAAHRVGQAGVDQRVDQRGGDQATRRVVHQHPVVWLGAVGQKVV